MDTLDPWGHEAAPEGEEPEARPLAQILLRRALIFHALALCLLALLLSGVEYLVLRHRTRQNLVHLAHRFAPVVQAARQQDPPQALGALTQALGREPGVDLVEVHGPDGVVQTFWQGDHPPASSLTVDQSLDAAGSYLRVASSEDWILSQLLETVLKTTTVLLPLGLLYLLLMAHLIRRHLLVPLGVLSREVAALADRDEAIPVVWPRSQGLEFTTVQAAFNRLMGRLGQHRARQVQHQLELEDRLAMAIREATAKGQWFSSLFEAAHAGIVVLDRDLRIVDCNPAFAARLGAQAGAFRGRTFLDFMPAEDQDLERDLLQACLDGRRQHYRREKRMLRPDGQTLWMDQAMAALQDGEGHVTQLLALLVDITSRRQNEAALAQAVQASRQAAQAKGEFLANMSHEIRTPMNGILGMTDLALRTELTPRQREYLLKIRTSSRLLLGIMNDVLDFSKMEAGQLDLESTDFALAGVLESLDDLLGPATLAKGLELRFQVGPGVPEHLLGDPMRLGQVLSNLVGNAVKFTEHGHVTLEVSTSEVDGISFAVRDTGIGIHAAKLPLLFEPFTQADGSSTRRHGGMGMGLAICRRLVEAMGGTLRAESTLGQGSCFTFHLPLRRPTAHPSTRKALPPHLQGLRILVVDDMEDFRNILGKLLTSMGFRVALAPDGESALDVLRAAPQAEPFQLALVDWRMPGMDGLMFCAEVRRDPHLGTLPLVLMTGYGRESAMVGAEKLGIEAFLLKPILPGTLRDTIVELFPEDAPAPLRLEASEPTPELGLAGGRILLVEDNDINLDVALGLLAGLELDIHVAHHGREAVEAVWGTPFDAVLMDVQMPVLDGLEATRLIRGEPRFAKLPIIAMTAHAMKGDRERCLEAGMNDYLSKPLEGSEMVAVLRRWVHVARPTPSPIPPSPPPPAAAPVLPMGNDLPEQLPGLNLKEALGRLMGNREILLRMLRAFRAEYDQGARLLATQVQEGARDEARRTAHTLKGLAGQMGAPELREAALELELALRSKEPRDFTPLLDAVARTLGTVLTSLDQLALASPGSPSAPSPVLPPADPSRQQPDTGPLLQAFEAALRCQDFLAASHLESLAGVLPDPTLDRLREALEGFDYRRALTILQAESGQRG